ncbi:hypothetical protein [Deinococcus aestuarii]|uniref:hypothetical protein n=1 Tax=Deinococcus aestuarii TaxID=2774531 RepID=UPI001C0C60EC|nr:hypothetical protein [Deinococcus aestuarii]
MESREVLVYLACFLGALLVARVPLSPPSTGQRVGMVLLLLACVASVWGLLLGVPGGPDLLLFNSVTALVCGFTLGFGVFKRRDRSVKVVSKPLPPPRPMREEAPWVMQLGGGILVYTGFYGLVSLSGLGQESSLGGVLLQLGVAAMFLWLGLAIMILPLRWKLTIGMGGSVLALVIGVLLPPGTL